jgi:hypothetical protein
VRRVRVLAVHRQAAIPAFARLEQRRAKRHRREIAGGAGGNARDEASVAIDDPADPAVRQALPGDEFFERIGAHDGRQHVRDLAVADHGHADRNARLGPAGSADRSDHRLHRSDRVGDALPVAHRRQRRPERPRDVDDLSRPTEGSA